MWPLQKLKFPAVLLIDRIKLINFRNRNELVKLFRWNHSRLIENFSLVIIYSCIFFSTSLFRIVHLIPDWPIPIFRTNDSLIFFLYVLAPDHRNWFLFVHSNRALSHYTQNMQFPKYVKVCKNYWTMKLNAKIKISNREACNLRKKSKISKNSDW